MDNLIVTIMAAGEGKRMNSDIPKVLHLFKGIPMLLRIILEVIKLQPKKIIIITGKYDFLIKTTIKEYCENMSNLNISISDYEKIQQLIFIRQNIPNGTGDAIKCTLDCYDDNENVLILNGDTPLLSHFLLNKFLKNKDMNQNFSEESSLFSGEQSLKENKDSAKLLVSTIDNPYGYGRIIYDENNNFIEIKEEKDCDKNEKKINVINAGIYLFNSDILKKYIPLINNNNAQKEYYLTDIIKIIRNNDSNINVKTYLIEDELKYQIHGVNTQQELKNLEEKY